MAPEELAGTNLGEKHRNYNKLVYKAIESNELRLDHFDVDEPDVHNMMKIDVASAKRNVDYLLKVLVCEDLFYVSRVINKCKWLITDVKYSDIFNPQKLHSTLLIKMCTKAANKLVKNIQIHLRDEHRVEQFYEYESNPREAVKWLPHCSVEFIKNKIVQHIDHIKLSKLKLIASKSILLLEIYIKNCDDYMKAKALQATTFLLRTDANRYLDLLKHISRYDCIKFNAKETKLLLECNSNLIISNYVHFDYCIDIPTFIKFLQKENVEEFLLNLSRKREKRFGHLLDNKHLQLFLAAMPEDKRLEFVRKVFIDKIFDDDSSILPETEKSALRFLHDSVFIDEYFWYQYASFETAFKIITKMIDSDVPLRTKQAMLSTLITCAKSKHEHIHCLVEYFNKHHRSSLDLKCHFIKELIVNLKFLKLETNTWKRIENIILKSDLDDSEEAQTLIRILIVYKILYSQNIAKTIEDRLQFDSFKMFKNKLDTKEKDLIFNYLYNHVFEITAESDKTEDEINECIKKLHRVFILLADWSKDLKQYPLVLNEAKVLIKQVSSNLLHDIDFIYNIKKSWRKCLFEESLHLKLDKYTLMNALKHDSSLIQKYSTESNCKKLTSVPSVSEFLKKIKIYFATSLTKDFQQSFLNDLSDINNHVNVTRGLLQLNARNQNLDMLEKYVPKLEKIIDIEIDTETLSLQRHFAKNMHIARPQPPPQLILSYAKGDYLQYSLPSLLSILYNLNKIKSRIYIQKLLDSQVSLQKHGIRLAFTKLEPHELTDSLSTMWKDTRNLTIRSVIFKVVFELLCKEKDSSRKNEIWKLLIILIDNLTLKEEKSVYNRLQEIDNIPSEFRSQYFVKVYPFLEELVKLDGETFSDSVFSSFVPHARNLMSELSPQFMTKFLFEHINNKFSEKKYAYWDWAYSIIPLISSFLLCSTDIDSQMKKHDEIFVPFLKHSLTIWNDLDNGKYCNRNYLRKFLDHLCQDVTQFSLKNNYIIPINLFLTIQKELEDSFPVYENYLMLTKWNLAVAFVKILKERKSNCNDTWLDIAEDFGKLCASHLKEDCKKYFSYIHTLFATALENVLDSLIENDAKYKVYKSMLEDKDFTEAYLVVIKLIPKHESNDMLAEKYNELRINISEHPSLEVKIHYNYMQKK